MVYLAPRHKVLLCSKTTVILSIINQKTKPPQVSSPVGVKMSADSSMILEFTNRSEVRQFYKAPQMTEVIAANPQITVKICTGTEVLSVFIAPTRLMA